MTAAGSQRSLGLHLWWTMVLVVAALGGAGLAVAADRQANPVDRPELFARAAAAAQPSIDQLAMQLDAVHNDATNLSTAGRDVLDRLQVLDLDGANVALASGDQTAADIVSLAAGLHDAAAQADSAIERWRVGPTVAGLLDQLDGAIDAADQLPIDWAGLADTGRTVAGVVAALNAHDAAVFAATTAGRGARWADALGLLGGAAADALGQAQAGRDKLARTTTVETLNDLLGREQAYDAALTNLYAYLRDGGSQLGATFDALQAAVTHAQAALHADNGALVVIVGEAAGLPIADQLLAMEKVHGTINDALQAVSDLRTGGPASDAAAPETPAP